ncbi:MAG: hypothetical protein A9Z00_00540 [Thermobacillus sp. ZCTH02-B1]|uniref:hypothetical protein n=1 Tax=Thermobacillus sp. ZCTH02-B1 TaxID=1858795 RepID=UPI000B551E8E|nr:hypothetical protein [Thermobacillus sp. ZCTH02-B1]OUM94149.1 MAG: hypothetical protein A9Z00_00540 [Thermobacillus sp. ZCTH02-B1]
MDGSRTRRILLLGAAGIALFMLVYLGYPAVKLEVISRHYQLYGSYAILPGDAPRTAEKPLALKTRRADYEREGIRLTNVLYYRELGQLAFGYIYGDDRQALYDIALLDAEGRKVPGDLMVTGSDRFHAKRLQKLNFRLAHPLDGQAAYTILITDERGERVGALEFGV